MMDINRNIQLLNFQQHGDERGNLVVIEGVKNIPFEIKRAFYIYGSDLNVIRGQHANKESEFVFINVAGTSKIKVKDGKGLEEIFDLKDPTVGLYLPKMVWKEMYEFSDDSVLLVLASTCYDPDEYIRDYDEFVTIVQESEEK